MPNRPKPRPTVPQTFDVFKPGKGRPSPTSRPVIVSHKPQVQDRTVVEKQGAPVANAHPVTVNTQPKPKPVLQSLATHTVAAAPAVPHGPAPRQVAPSAHAFHSAAASHHMITHANHAPTHEPEAVEPAPKKVSRSGSTVVPPSSSAGHKLHPIPINVTDQKDAKPAAPKEPEEPHLAALPITPVEAPSGLTSQKTEGKAELLAAMPIEIRRSIASDQGMSASDWEAPAAPAAAVPAAPAQATPAPAETAAANPTATPAPAAPAPAATPAPQPAAPAPASEELTNTEAVPAKPAKAKMKGKIKKPLSFDAIIFIIMFVLFVGLGALVVLLFLSGSVKI